MTSLCFDILGTRFAVHARDRRWTELLGRLWEPFVVPAAVPACRVEIGGTAGGWVMRIDDATQVEEPEPWMLALMFRHEVVRRALQRAHGIVELHAAVVVRDGAAMLIAGHGGAGKTRLALELAGAGWELYGDDLAPVDARSGLVLPCPKPLGIKDPEVWDRLRPRWDAPLWPPRWDGHMQVPAAAGPQVAFETGKVGRRMRPPPPPAGSSSPASRRGPPGGCASSPPATPPRCAPGTWAGRSRRGCG